MAPNVSLQFRSRLSRLAGLSRSLRGPAGAHAPHSLRRMAADYAVMGLVTLAAFVVLLVAVERAGGPGYVLGVMRGSFSPGRTADYSARFEPRLPPQRVTIADRAGPQG